MTVVTTTISDKSGTAMKSTYELLSVDIEREVNRIPRCNLKLIDGDLAKKTFPISDSVLFEPGAEISVKLRYEQKGEVDAVVFKGVVVRHGIELSRRGSILNIELRDKAVALTQPRKSVVHDPESSDAAVIAKLADAAGLSGTVETTKPKYKQLVQYGASDWDFILARAEAQGLVFAVTDGVYTLGKLEPAGAAHKFEVGKDELFAIDLEADGLHQLTGVEGLAWDMAEKAPTAAATAATVKNPLGNLDGEKVAKALGFPKTKLSNPVPFEADELKAWADGRLARSRWSMVRGRVSTRGAAKFKLLDSVELVGVGARFLGKSAITGIRHRVTNGGWQTDIQLGYSPELFGSKSTVSEPPAAGLLPAVSGLQVGVIAPFEDDPLNALRFKVILPGIDAGAAGAVWARLATPDAGANRGYVFRPEPGDEVVVGFFNGDPRQPVILGSMFGAQNTPPPDVGNPTEDNLFRAIVSRKGLTIGFIDDDKPSVFIETPAKNKLIFSDDLETISLSDQHGNSITLEKDGITIKSAKDVIIDGSGGNVTIKGTKVDVQ
jgi:Rhs element Vgr protein